MAAKLLGPEVVTELEAHNLMAVQNDIDGFFAKAHPDLQKKLTPEIMADVFDLIKGNEILKQDLLNASKNFHASLGSQKVTSYRAAYEVQTDEAFHIFRYGWVDQGEGLKLVSFYVDQSETSFKEANAFGTAKKTWKHYLVIIGMIIVPLFIIFTVYACIKTPGLRRKWLWVIFILFGIHGIIFNWSSGDISNTFFNFDAETSKFTFSIIQFNVLGIGATKANAVAPWIFSLYFPLGAVIFWFRHRGRYRDRFAAREEIVPPQNGPEGD